MSSYPPTLTDPERDHLRQVAKDFATAHGLTVRPPPAVIAAESDPHDILTSHAPVTLFPSPFPSVCFDQAEQLQKAYNELYARISQDEDYITQIVKEVADGDDFIANLWKVHLKVKQEGYTQPISLGLFRSDYMVHKDPTSQDAIPQLKQVEFNTIASSFGGLSTQASRLHRFLAESEYPYLQQPLARQKLDLPSNNSAESLAEGIAVAHKAYGPSELDHKRCIVFLVQDGERNVFDQRHLEYALHKHAGDVPVFRLPFSQIMTRTRLAGTTKRQLLYSLPTNPDHVFEVSVVYMRAGYGPGDYQGQSSWDARYHLERSSAIKCPTVLTQLAGTKKVQQVLATPKMDDASPSELGRFVPEASRDFEKLWRTFTNIYPLDGSPAGLAARKLALDPDTCRRYVLKPQREGGGNNHYKDKIPGFLKSVPETHWPSYILMELIVPPPVSNIIMRNGQLEQGGVICELGRYGTCVWNQETKEIMHNRDAGYLLRTKGDQSEEGGVAAGFGCMDSCSLVA